MEMKKKLQIVFALIVAMTSGAALYRYYISLSLNHMLGDAFVEVLYANETDNNSGLNSDLPNLLIIGDSISKGYMNPLKIILNGKINVEQIPNNAKDTTYTLSNIREWLNKSSKSDLILFNNGLHDLACVDQNGKPTTPSEGKFKVSIELYRKNMNEIVGILKKTGAKLLFITTTPIPQEAVNRIAGSEIEYNDAAIEIMEKHRVAVCDLHTIVSPLLPIIQNQSGIHFNPIGSWVLATGIASVILSQQ